MNPQISQLFDELADYRNYCVIFGRVYNEAELRNMKSENYRDFLDFKKGTRISNHWSRDRKKVPNLDKVTREVKEKYIAHFGPVDSKYTKKKY